jgi:hypothetical protein
VKITIGWTALEHNLIVRCRRAQPLQTDAVNIAPPAGERGGHWLAAEYCVRGRLALVRGELLSGALPFYR